MAESVLKLAQHSSGATQPVRVRPAMPDAPFGPRELEAALDQRHFRVEYQPKVALFSEQTSQFGVEALCRIQDPALGAIAPDHFIAIAESSGLIFKLTDAVVCDAFQAWRAWHSAGLSIRLALNVSPLLLADRAWLTRFLQRCDEFRMDPKWVTLEITETAAGATSEQAGAILRSLHEKGFKISIDDFGTGFSSLATLYRLPILEMKIDKSFVLEMDRNPGAREVVESAIAMAKRLGIKVVAEGVETEKAFEELRRMGCDEVQGFFVGRSIPAEAIVPFFTNWRKSRGAAGGSAVRQLPKVALIQALLNELAHDIAPPVPARPGPYGAPVAPTVSADRGRDLLLKIPPLILGGKTLPALAACHEAMRLFERMPGGHAPCSRIGKLQSLLEGDLLAGGKLEIRTDFRTYRLLPQDSVTLGRPSPTAAPDIAVQCSWFNPAERSLRIFRQDDQYFVADTGSRHGHLVDGARLDPKRPAPIPPGNPSVGMCLACGAPAPVSLVLRLHGSDAVSVEFEYDAETLLTELGAKAWTALKGQLETRWILFNGKVSLGRSTDCAIVLRDCAAPVAAEIAFEDGYWITPSAGAALKAGDTSFRQRLPLLLDAVFDLAGAGVTVAGAP